MRCTAVRISLVDVPPQPPSPSNDNDRNLNFQAGPRDSIAAAALAVALAVAISAIMVLSVLISRKTDEIKYLRARAVQFWRGWSRCDKARKWLISELKRIKRDNPWAS